MEWVEGQVLFSVPMKGPLEAQEGSGMWQWKPRTSNPSWWTKNKTIFSISLHLRIHPGVNSISGQSEVVGAIYKPVPSPRLQPVQEKSIFQQKL